MVLAKNRRLLDRSELELEYDSNELNILDQDYHIMRISAVVEARLKFLPTEMMVVVARAKSANSST